uniref:Uncharacterized protein n=1 Tax=Lynx canadensis TaxID=61383 RepID=A0A667HIH7_LYNCA
PTGSPKTKSSTPETGAALFNNPTSSSNSDHTRHTLIQLLPILTEISKLPPFSSLLLGALKALVRTSSEGPDGSFRCCR